MKTKYILFLFIVLNFSAFAQKVDTMLYQPTYSATETFSMRVGRLLETRVTYIGTVNDYVTNLAVNVHRLYDLRSGERQIGVEISTKHGKLGMIDEDELDEFIKNLETIKTTIVNINPQIEKRIWFTTKGGIRIMLIYMPAKSKFSSPTWEFTIGVFDTEASDHFSDRQLDKNYLPAFIFYLKKAQKEIKE
jgi:hypothetical protein